MHDVNCRSYVDIKRKEFLHEVTKSLTSKIQTFINGCFRRILKESSQMLSPMKHWNRARGLANESKEWWWVGHPPRKSQRDKLRELECTGSVQKRVTKNNMGEDGGEEGKSGRKNVGRGESSGLEQSPPTLAFQRKQTELYKFIKTRNRIL